MTTDEYIKCLEEYRIASINEARTGNAFGINNPRIKVLLGLLNGFEMREDGNNHRESLTKQSH